MTNYHTITNFRNQKRHNKPDKKLSAAVIGRSLVVPFVRLRGEK